MTIRVLLADDQALIRSGFAALLGSAPDLDVVGQAVDGEQAVLLARQLQPDVVLMDLRMPGMGGIAATRRITADLELRNARVVVLITFEDDENVVQALRAGASGFLGKGIEPADLIEAVRVVASGEALLSPRATRALIERYVRHDSERGDPTTRDVVEAGVPEALGSLTDRERELTGRVALGLSN